MAGTESNEIPLQNSLSQAAPCCLTIDFATDELFFQLQKDSSWNLFSIDLRRPIAQNSARPRFSMNLDSEFSKGIGSSSRKTFDVYNGTLYAFQQLNSDQSQLIIFSPGMQNNQVIPLKNITAVGGVINTKLLAKGKLNGNSD